MEIVLPWAYDRCIVCIFPPIPLSLSQEKAAFKPNKKQTKGPL
jgi:hypothetical protein